MTSESKQAEGAAPPWHAEFPSPRDQPLGKVTREEMLQMLKEDEASSKSGTPRNFVLIDLRRTDYEGGTIRGAINLPAQSIYPTIPSLYRLFEAANVRKVICYCGSSGGRGTRVAGWFRDYISDQGDGDMEGVILEGGIKGWVKAGGEYTQDWMIGYDASHWG